MASALCMACLYREGLACGCFPLQALHTMQACGFHAVHEGVRLQSRVEQGGLRQAVVFSPERDQEAQHSGMALCTG